MYSIKMRYCNRKATFENLKLAPKAGLWRTCTLFGVHVKQHCQKNLIKKLQKVIIYFTVKSLNYYRTLLNKNFPTGSFNFLETIFVF